MSLYERLQNTLYHWLEAILMNLLYYPEQQATYETAFPSSHSFRPFWDKVKHGVSMVRESVAFPIPAEIKLIAPLGFLEQSLLVEFSATVFAQFGKNVIGFVISSGDKTFVFLN